MCKTQKYGHARQAWRMLRKAEQTYGIYHLFVSHMYCFKPLKLLQVVYSCI